MKKSKIIALLMATACMATVFAGCNEEETPCAHVDADKNYACDLCGAATHVIVEQVPAEEEAAVEMVVKSIPTDVAPSTYIGPKADAEVETPAMANLTVTTKISENDTVSMLNERYYKLTQTESYGYYDWTTTTKIYDVQQDKIVYTKTTNNYDNESVTVTNKGAYIKITEYSYNNGYKTKFYTQNWGSIETFNESVTESGELDGKYYYLTIEDKVYVLDMETNEKVTLTGASGALKDVALRRPAFDCEKNGYGYIVNDDGIWVYDLSKWVSCVYHKEIPSYWEDAEMIVLDNGNVLVQYAKQLPDTAINYDVLIGGEKFDLVQTVINPTTKASTNVELGYKMEALDAYALEKYNDEAKNVVKLYPIENKEIDGNAGFEAVIDNDVNILYAHKATLMGQNIDEFEYVEEGVYLSRIDYGNGEYVSIFVDGNGAEIVKIPTAANEYYGNLIINGVVYDKTLTKLFDTADYGTTIAAFNDYALYYKAPETMTEEGKYYYYDGTGTPKVIVGAIVNKTDNYYVVRTGTSGDYRYTLYAADGKKIPVTSGADYISAVDRVNQSGEMWEVRVRLNDNTEYTTVYLR